MRTFKDTRGKCNYDIIPELEGQLDIAHNYPGTIRAFHCHMDKTEWMYVVSGEFKFVLQGDEIDTEPEGKEIIYLSAGEKIQINPFVWHGYQVVGNEPGIIIEYATKKHDMKDPDDQRKPYDEYDDWKKEKK
jgi:dTDP-4-dehydrorhamnose 3,5-epimerase